MRATVGAIGLAGLILLLALVALSVGPLAVAPLDMARALFGAGAGEAELALSLRAPRVIAGVAVGAGLAAAGAAYQSVFRNPLAAPDLLGVSGGAALGAALALFMGWPTAAVMAAAFLGGLATVGLALIASRAARHGDPVLSLVLCGVVAGALASAALALILWLADPYSQLPAISYWLLGSLARADLGQALTGASVAGACVLALWRLGSGLDGLMLGEEQARSLGVDAPALRRLVIVLATLAAAAAVAMAGIVGWLGLLAPHAARLLVGDRGVVLVPASAGLGALMVLVLDLVARSLGPVEVPLGVLTAAVGAPAFLILFVALGRGR